MTIGTYTRGRDSELAIFRAWVEADGSRIGMRGGVSVAPTVDPTWVVFSDDGRYVYAACEGAEGAVAALEMSRAGELTLLNIQPTGGADTCHVAIVNGGTHLVAANYQSGSVSVHPILPDGTLGERTCLVQHEGSGPDPDRQAGPHAHMIAEAPDGRAIFAVDLGTDTLYGYALDAATGTLTEISRTVLRPGFGPRHLAFHRNGEVVYVLGELGFEVAVCAFDAAAGSLTVLSTFPVIEDGEPGVDYPSGIRVTPGGRFLHVAVRGRDELRTFSLVADPRKPELASTVPTGGSWPRDMVLSPDGTLLFSANQLSNELVVFRLDPFSGLPTPTGARLSVPAPACVLMRCIARSEPELTA
jgi:6-phosphogluconolactonase